MTMYCCVNAIGHLLPPVYIFPRVHFKNNMLKGALSESLGLVHPFGWMNGDLFAEAMNHFIQFMRVSEDNPALPLMYNHISHLSNDAIEMAKEYELCMLTFSSHCSHKVPPVMALIGCGRNGRIGSA